MREALTTERVIELLGLEEHPEGGHFVETFRPAESAPAVTSILYLLTPTGFSALHRLAGDEIWYFHLGDPLEMLQLRPDGEAERYIMGTDLLAGQRPQVVVPRGTWQGSRLLDGGRFALVGCAVAPGFELADFELGRRDYLVFAYPQHAAEIVRLTR